MAQSVLPPEPPAMNSVKSVEGGYLWGTTKESTVAREAWAVFDRIKASLEASHANQFVAIEPISGDFFLGRTPSDAIGASRNQHPDRLAHAFRISHNETAPLAEGVDQLMTVKKPAIAMTSIIPIALAATSVAWFAARSATAHADAAVGAQSQDHPNGATDNEKEQIRARQRSSKNLRTIALAMYNYSSVAGGGRFPAAAIFKDEKPLLSWRVAILPFLGQQALYDKFHLDEPWDSPHNRSLIQQIPDVYSPVIPRGNPEGSTFYQVFVGDGAVFELDLRPKLDDFFDGPSQTALVVEAGKAVPWTKPEDVPFDKDKPLPRLGGQFANGFHILFADGSVLFLSKKIEEKTLRALITPRGSDPVSVDKLPVLPAARAGSN